MARNLPGTYRETLNLVCLWSESDIDKEFTCQTCKHFQSHAGEFRPPIRKSTDEKVLHKFDIDWF